MRHLFNSVCEVLTDKGEKVLGTHKHNWNRAEEMFDEYLGKVGYLQCRIDLTFLRPGKDDPSALKAGGIDGRIGILFCSPTSLLKVGHRVKCVYGPIEGTYDIMAIDPAMGYSSVSHFECPISQVARSSRNEVVPNIPDPPRRYDSK